jgi:hypothetical protein
VIVCPWCAEELAEDARRCTQCGRDPATRPVPDRRDQVGTRWWELPEPDPAAVNANPGRLAPTPEAISDLRGLEPNAGREAPINRKAFASTLVGGFGSGLFSALVALHLAKRAEEEIEASDGREGGEVFVTLGRVFAWITIGTVAVISLMVLASLFGGWLWG